jgi:hypothetical protein
MQIARRPLASGDTDYELLWLAVSVGGVGLAAVWFKLHLPWPICVFHNWTGHPCATCGATRAAIALLQGHFLAALAWNPLAFLAYCAIGLFDLYALAVLLAGAKRLRIVSLNLSQQKCVRLFLVSALAANWIYLLIANPSL